MPVDEHRARAALAEILRRQMEGLRLYHPMPIQEAFHKSAARERIVRGANRAGKTLMCALEVAQAVTGQDPLGRFPLKDGICYVVGKDGKHVGQVMYRKLFRAGAYQIIRDRQTGLWRAFNQMDPGDWERRADARPSHPLVPRRFIKDIAWENKKESLPKLIHLVNGWEIHFFSSLGKPPQGSSIDFAWFDEELIDQDWYPEITARLVDRSGYFLWSATPQAGTDQLFALHEEAERQAIFDGPKRIEEFVIRLKDNTHLTAEQKAEFEAKLSEEERQVRIEGEFVSLQARVFSQNTPPSSTNARRFPSPTTGRDSWPWTLAGKFARCFSWLCPRRITESSPTSTTSCTSSTAMPSCSANAWPPNAPARSSRCS